MRMAHPTCAGMASFMSNEPVSNPQSDANPNFTVENLSQAFEARIARFLGAGSFGFWMVFLAICLSAAGLLLLALLRS